MAKNSAELQDILDKIESKEQLVYLGVELKLNTPQLLVEFIQSTPDVEQHEIEALVRSLGIMFYNAIVETKPKASTWNLH